MEPTELETLTINSGHLIEQLQQSNENIETTNEHLERIADALESLAKGVWRIFEAMP